MTEELRVLPLCRMGLGGRTLGFKVEVDHMAYCWNCLCLPSSVEGIREHLGDIISGSSSFAQDLRSVEFYDGLQVKPRPHVPNYESDKE